jgi:hypothetical protein
MKTIHTIDDLQSYIQHLGFCCKPGFPGWIIQAQRDLWDVQEAIEEAAGIPKGKLENYPAYDAPFRVHFHRNAHAPSFPWLGAFTVIGSKGKQYISPPRR